MNTHPEQWVAIYAAALWEQLGVWGALLKSTSVVELRVERVLYIHSPTYNTYRTKTRTRNLSITSPTL